MLERLLTALPALAVSAAMSGCATIPEPRLPRPSQNGQQSIEELNRVFELYGNSIRRAAAAHELDAALIAAVIRYESNANSEAISSTGCTGLMQVCRGSATAPIEVVCAQERSQGPEECYSGKCEMRNGVKWCEPCRGRDYCLLDDRFYPQRNVDCGVKVLKGKISHYRGKYRDYLRLGIAAYNAGEGIIDAAIKETGEKDPSWEKVHARITISIFRKFRSYDILTDALVERKINGLDDYVEKVYGAYQKYEKKNKENREMLVGWG